VTPSGRNWFVEIAGASLMEIKFAARDKLLVLEKRAGAAMIIS
jgi:hypothetical protein